MPAGLAAPVSCAGPLGPSATLAGVTLSQESPAAACIATGPAALFFTVTFAVALLLAALVSVTTEGVADTGAGAGVAGCESLGRLAMIRALQTRQPPPRQRSARGAPCTPPSPPQTRPRAPPHHRPP